MYKYRQMLQLVLARGVRKPTRAKVDGKHVDALSFFGMQERFSLRDEFPVVTTKYIHLHSVVHELLWFISGSTNIKYLQDNNVRIWNEWADENGELGPVYGKQWRDWEGKDGRRVDQLAQLITNIKKVKEDPTCSFARRLIISAWNVTDLPDMVLMPCHLLVQFSIENDELSCLVYMRSADMFLGVPFNISSYALLTCMVAQVTGLKPGHLISTIGDAHIYDNHLPQVREQLSRQEFPLPRLQLDPSVTSIDDFTYDHIQVVNYQHHPAIPGKVAV